MKKVLTALLASTVILLCACSQPKEKPQKLTLFAAAGTRSAIEEICLKYEQEYGIEIQKNYASSGTLARQIASGADSSVYVSANKKWVDFLIDEDLLIKGSVQRIAGNKLVIITPKGAPQPNFVFSNSFDFSASAPNGIALGDPAYVPVGSYAKKAFSALEVFDSIKSNAVMCKDVSAVLKYIELGEMSWGIVYQSEAHLSKKVDIAALIPTELYGKITFYTAVVKGADENAVKLKKYIAGDEGRAIFQKYGFTE